MISSMDGGATWNDVNFGPKPVNIRALAIDPDGPATIYSGSGSDGIFAVTIVP